MLHDDVHNRELLDHVHPPKWENPTPDGPYNLVVIGAGTAGLVTASGAAGVGARVALIERRLMGGDCLNYGCVPSKALIRAARAVADARRLSEFGGSAQQIDVDFAAVMERMRRLRAQIAPVDGAPRFSEMGIDVYFGQARFAGEGKISVDDTVLEYSKAVIASGARPFVPPIEGLEEAGYRTNEDIFDLTALPDRLAVVGGGPIGAELAQSFARFGAQVHLFERLPQLLGREDADAADIVKAALLNDGVHLHLGSSVTRVERAGGQKRIFYAATEGDETSLIVDEVLLAVGRAPNVEDMGLEHVGVEFDRRGVKVDDRMQTTNSSIFAAGDVASKYKFTHSADFQARAVIQNALFFGRKRASSLVIPWATYTDPEVAQVGLTEAGAEEEGVAVDVYRQGFEDVDRAILDGETHGFVKVLTRRGTDEIVGATICATHAGEMIGEVTLAMTHGLGLRAIAETIHPYPTQIDALRRTGDQYNRTRLTPRVKASFEKFLGWRR